MVDWSSVKGGKYTVRIVKIDLGLPMFIAHLPAGYLVTKFVCRNLRMSAEVKNKVMASGLLGAIAPDLDLFYWSLVDRYRDHHHSYWSHYPVAWLLLLLTSHILFRVHGKGYRSYGLLLFSLNGFFHLILDSMAGEIRWLMPFENSGYSLAMILPDYSPWFLNFILHWTFLVEISIVALCCLSLYRSIIVR
ncbi:MAG: metal-dependent hydrolase [Candidatus Thiodiazotropha lotti]